MGSSHRFCTQCGSTASSNQSSDRMLRSKRESCFTRKGILMLNETYVLWQALDRARLPLPREHPRVKLPGSSAGPCLCVRLDEQGRVAAVETVTKDEWPGFWTVMEGNHNSFPV